MSPTNGGDYFENKNQSDTHEDFPLPVGPRIALRPGLIIPLRDNNTQLSN